MYVRKSEDVMSESRSPIQRLEEPERRLLDRRSVGLVLLHQTTKDHAHSRPPWSNATKEKNADMQNERHKCNETTEQK